MIGIARGLAAFVLSLVFILGMAVWSTAARAPPVQERATPTLYQRLGGYDAIAGFVDRAFPRVTAHPVLQRFFHGHSQESKLRQRQLIVDMLCQSTGGPCFYTGRAMKPVHAGLGITESQWGTFSGIIDRALDELLVPTKEKEELLEIFARRFRPDVVEEQ